MPLGQYQLTVVIEGQECDRVLSQELRHAVPDTFYYYFFIHSRQAPLDDCLSQPLSQNSLSLLDNAARTSNQPSAACRPIPAVAAAAGSRPWASSVRLSPHYSLPVLVKIPPGTLANVRLSPRYKSVNKLPNAYES